MKSIACLFLLAAPIFAQSIQVSYKQQHETVDLQKIAHSDVVAKDHDGKEHTFSCIPLSQVLAAVQAPSGEKLRGPNMTLAVVASASDNYKAAFSLAEVDEGIGGKQVFVCDKQDGTALPPKDGPARLIVPSDKRPARWVRMLTSIQVVDAAASESSSGSAPQH